MKKIILATTIAASTLLAVPNDGIVIGLGLGNTSTTSTVKTEGYLNSTSSEDESGSTAEFSIAYRMKSNYQFGLTGGSISVEGDSSVGYKLLTADYIFMEGSKWRPFVGLAIGSSDMDYTYESGTIALNITETATASGFRLGIGYESGNWTYGYRYQSLSTDLEGADTLFEDTRYETKFDVSHKDFTTSMFFVNYHF